MQFRSERDPDRAKVVDKKLRKELGDWLTGSPKYTSFDLSDNKVEDNRTRWQKFIQSSDIAQVGHRMQVDVPVTRERTLTLSVEIGVATAKLPYPLCMGVTMTMPIELNLVEPMSFVRKGKKFDGPAAAERLNRDRKLCKRIAFLVQHGYHVGATTVSRPNAAFVVTPTEDETLAIVATVPQETWGGFVLRLGAHEFIDIVDQIESIAQ